MSPRQVADDPGRQIRGVYLGPKNMRMPVDWTFEEWGLALIALVFGTALLVFVIPAGLAIGVAAVRLGRVVGRLTSPDRPRRNFRLFVGAVALLCLLFSSNPMTWLRPLFFPLALLAGLALPIYVVRTHGKYLNWNRPFGYWIRLPRIIAAGPREGQQEVTGLQQLMLGMDLEKADHRRDLEPIVKPAVITSPPKYGKSPKSSDVEYRLVPLEVAPPVKRATPIRHQARHKMVERTEQGFRVGATEYRMEWRF